jgi:PIN domain nuclease of toxin-antitoxin system
MNRLLLDTHTFLWWDSAPDRLSATVLALCRDPSVILFLSLVSLWEIQAQRGLQLLPILPAHIYALDSLPPYHKNPFDRLLIAQAMTESLPLASADGLFSPYPVSLIW